MAKLDANKRNNLSKGSFAEPGKRKYPIPDASHARNALARASGNASPSEQKKIREAVEKKFPGINVGGKKPKKGK